MKNLLKIIGIIFGIIIVTLMIIGFLRTGSTVIERKVFENSFQYHEGKKEAISTYRAQLAEIEIMLRSRNISARQRNELESQASGIRIMLAREESK